MQLQLAATSFLVLALYWTCLFVVVISLSSHNTTKIPSLPPGPLRMTKAQINFGRSNWMKNCQGNLTLLLNLRLYKWNKGTIATNWSSQIIYIDIVPLPRFVSQYLPKENINLFFLLVLLLLLLCRFHSVWTTPYLGISITKQSMHILSLFLF